MKYLTILSLSVCVACSALPVSGPADPQGAFFASLQKLCGQAFAGRLVSTDAVDEAFGKQAMTMNVRECSEREIRIPFHVADDHSRTWVITRQVGGLRLKHDHRHEDGSEDAVTQYGGDTADAGTVQRQSFPVDTFSIDMFNREGLSASVTNVWSIEMTDDLFAYELSRENRFFRVEFDLRTPVEAPLAPWGHE